LKVKKSFIFNIAIAIVVASLVVTLSDKGALKRIKLASSDFFFRIRPPLRVSPHIIVIEITDDDIAKIGRWPWERTWHAAITKALKQFGVKYIYFDMVFSEASSEKEDALFGDAMKDANCVYLPFAFQQHSISMKDALFPIPSFSSYIKGTGSINIYPDIDGVLRRVPLLFVDNEGVKMHIALRLAMDYLNMSLKGIANNCMIIGNAKDRIRIPLVDGNKMLINWLGKWEHTFRHYSFLDVLGAYKDCLDNNKPSIDISSFKDSICVVAVTAIGLYDIKPIPLEAQYPGVGATLTVVNNILYRQFINIPPGWCNWMLIYILAFLPPLLISEERPLREILSVVSVLIVALLGYLLFVINVEIDISLPLLALLGSYIAVGTYNFTRISMERRSFFNLAVTDGLTGLYNVRYFRMLMKTECMMARDDSSKSFCIFMIDIDHFKNFNDTYGHQVGDLVLREVSEVIKNSVRASDIAARYGGEEMIVMLKNISLDEGLNAAEKIRSNIETHLVKDKDNVCKVTVSIGVSSFCYDDDENVLIKRADDALYKAKRMGRNRVETIENVVK